MAKKRIYRLATGENGNSDYLFVAEIDGGLTEFTDNRLDVELAESLPSLDCAMSRPSPEGSLRHILRVASTSRNPISPTHGRKPTTTLFRGVSRP